MEKKIWWISEWFDEKTSGWKDGGPILAAESQVLCAQKTSKRIHFRRESKWAVNEFQGRPALRESL